MMHETMNDNTNSYRKRVTSIIRTDTVSAYTQVAFFKLFFNTDIISGLLFQKHVK